MAVQVRRKPKPSVAPRGPVTSVPQPTTRPALKPRAAPKAAAAPRPAPTPPPAAPVQEALPAAIPTAPLTLPSSTADRATARSIFGGDVATTNRQLIDLARNLGGISSAEQFAYNPGADPREIGSYSASQGAVDPNDPNSTMAVIARNLSKNLNFVGDTNLDRNTYSSGIRLTQEDEQRTDANNARAKAVSDYNTARLGLIDALTGTNGAWGQLGGVFGSANAAEREAANAAAAKAPAQGSAPGAAAPASAPAAAPPKTQVLKTKEGQVLVSPEFWNPAGYWDIPNWRAAGRKLRVHPDGRVVVMRM